MVRHASAKKAARQSRKSNAVNRALRTQINTALRNVLEAKQKKEAQESLRTAFSVIDKSVKRHLIHPNNAARKKMRLSAHVNRLA